MQVEQLSSIKEVSAASLTAVPSNGHYASSTLDTSTATKQLEKLSSTVVGLSKSTIVKQAITPMNSKTSLLKFLNGSKSFKTIGDRIVVPMKVAVPSKKLLAATNKSSSKPSTFQMTVPYFPPFCNKTTSSEPSPGLVSFKYGISQSQTQIATHKSFSQSQDDSAVQKPPNVIPVKAECISEHPQETNDLNRFMNSVAKNVFFPIKAPDDASDMQNQVDRNAVSTKATELEDEELTSLTWLSSNNKKLLDTIRMCNPDDPGIGLSGDDTDSEDISDKNKLIFTASSRINCQVSTLALLHCDRLMRCFISLSFDALISRNALTKPSIVFRLLFQLRENCRSLIVMINTAKHHIPHIISKANYECGQKIKISSGTSSKTFSSIEKIFPINKKQFFMHQITV